MLNEGDGYFFFFPSSKGEERMVTYLTLYKLKAWLCSHGLDINFEALIVGD